METYPDNNMGAVGWYPVGSIQNEACGTTTNPFACRNRSLIKFDFQGLIPPGSRIINVDFRVWVTVQPPNVETDFNTVFDFHRMLLPWGKGTGANGTNFPGSVGRPVLPGESSWLMRLAPSNSWGIPGGADGIDYATQSSALAQVFTEPGTQNDFIVSGISNRLVADVQHWVDNPNQNFGWLTKARHEEDRWTAKRFMNIESGIDDYPRLVVSFTPPPTVSYSALVLDPQSGLFRQTVTVSNVDETATDPVRVLIQGLTNGVTVANASGSTNGIPFIQLNRPLEALESVSLTIEYYVPDRVAPVPALAVRYAVMLPVGNFTGQAQPILRKVPLADGSFLIDFQSLSNRVYHVQYSADMVTWRTVSPSLLGTGSTVQWIDNGPPKTDPPPQAEPTRFYRVLLAP